MYWELYLALFALAGVCSLAVLLRRKSVIPLGFTSGALWSILALQARNIVIYHQDGTSTVVESQPWQFVSLGLALLMLATVLLYWWGVFPPDERPANRDSIEQETDDMEIKDVRT